MRSSEPFQPGQLNQSTVRWGEVTAVNMFSSTIPNPLIAWEGEAPAEPLRRKLGRSLALPLISDGSTWERCLERWGEAPAEPLRSKVAQQELRHPCAKKPHVNVW